MPQEALSAERFAIKRRPSADVGREASQQANQQYRNKETSTTSAMKTAIVVLALATVITIVTPSPSPADNVQLKERAMKMMNECQQETKATEADVKSLMAKKMPTSHEGLCLIECMFSKGKFMKDGRFDKDGAIEASIGQAGGDKAKEAQLRTMMSECATEIGDGEADKCLTAKRIVECIDVKGKAMGYKYPGHD